MNEQSTRVGVRDALAEHPGLLEDLVARGAGAAAVVDADGRLLWASEGFAVLDLTDPSVDLTWGRHGAPVPPAAIAPVVDHARSSGREVVERLGPDRLAVRARPWRDSQGDVRAVVVSVDRAEDDAAARWSENERRYRLLAEQATEVVSLLDPADGVVRYVSPSARQVLGYDPDELVGRHHTAVLHPEDGADADTADRLAAGETVVRCSRVRRGDGRWVLVESVARRVQGHEGAVVQVSSRDVSERVRATSLARASSAIDRALLDSSDWHACLRAPCEPLAELLDCEAVLVHAVDGSGGLQLAAAEPGPGLPEPGALRQAPSAISLPVRDAADHLVAVLTFHARRSERIDDDTAERLAAVADRLAVARRLIDERATVEAQRAELVAANHSLEARVRARTADLRAALDELESFSYSVSHDLRAPLRAIGAYADLVAEDQGERLDERGRADLARIREATAHLGELVDGLLELARVTRSDLDRVRVDLAAQAAQVAADLRAQHPGREVELVVAPALPRPLADPRLTRAVLANLLGNAWKFTAGRAVARVELRAEPGAVPGEVVYVVEDDGVGFEPAQGHRLFAPFQRLHRAEDFPGTGVGLATVARIVRRHGGRVEAEGRPGRGACIRFTLAPPPDGGGPAPGGGHG